MITFNVLDHVEYEPQTSKIILMGHRDANYATSGIPYLQYLATLLEYPSPQFSLEWTRDSELRVAELRRRLNSDDEWRRLAGEWGRWIDESEHVTPAGRYFMPLFGIEVPAAGQKMDRYQVLSGVFRAIGERQASEILAAFGSFYRAMPNPGIPQLYRLFRASGVYELFVNERSEFQAGRMTEYQVHVDVYRSMFRSFDQALNYSGQPTSTVFENMLRRGQTPDAAMGAAMGEFDRQFKGVYGDALRRLYRSKPEFQIPVSLVNPALRDTLNVEPRFISINSSTLLAKLLLDADVAAKKLLNAPELADKIPEYQTEVTYRLSRPASRPAGHVSTARLWISVEQIDASRSSDGNILALGETKMRINIRDQRPDGRDLANDRSDGYEALLSSLYDGFARHYSPVFHELREAAKLAYVAQWLKARNAAHNFPSAGLATWRAPTTVPGAIFISWSADPARPDVQTVSAIGGVTLRVPTVGPGVCVKFCEERIPTDARIKSISHLTGNVVELTPGVDQSNQSLLQVIGLYLSAFHNPFEAYASAASQEPPKALLPASCNGKDHCIEINCYGHKGKISATSYLDLTREHKPIVSVRYEGTDAGDLGWVQVMWTEFIVKKHSGPPEPLTTVLPFIRTHSGLRYITADPSAPRYLIDSLRSDKPFLEGSGPRSGHHVRDATTLTVFDQPESAIAIIESQGFDNPSVYEIEQRDHFDDFLVSGNGEVCGKESWTATFRKNRNDPVIQVNYKILELSASERPNAAQVKELNSRYPGFQLRR